MEREERRARAAQRAREDIVTAALEVLAEVDIAACRVEEIADRAGYSPGALYTYFRSKEDLLVAALERMNDEITAPFEEPPDEPAEFVPALTRVITESLSFLGRYRALMFAMFAGGRMSMVAHIGAALPERLRMQRETMIAQVDAWMTRGVELGVLAPEPAPKTYMYALMSLVRGLVEQWLESEEEVPPADLAQRAMAMFLNGARKRDDDPGEENGSGT